LPWKEHLVLPAVKSGADAMHFALSIGLPSYIVLSAAACNTDLHCRLCYNHRTTTQSLITKELYDEKFNLQSFYNLETVMAVGVAYI